MNAGMDALARYQLQQSYFPRRKSNDLLDRFTPSVDLEYAQLQLDRACEKQQQQASSPSREAFRTRLAEAMNLNRTSIFSYRIKPHSPPKDHYASSHLHDKPVKPRRSIPQSEERRLATPDLIDDLYLNLLDWGSANLLAIALNNTVYLWDASSGSTSELMTLEEDKGPVTSINWAHDGRHLAVGLSNAQVELWDSASSQLVRTMQASHQPGVAVASLASNDHILSTGATNGKIVNHDVRISSHVIGANRGHRGDVCGLKWSESGRQLASAGRDILVHIWDRSRPSQWLHRLRDHTSAVKALAWCPFSEQFACNWWGRR